MKGVWFFVYVEYHVGRTLGGWEWVGLVCGYASSYLLVSGAVHHITRLRGKGLLDSIIRQ